MSCAGKTRIPVKRKAGCSDLGEGRQMVKLQTLGPRTEFTVSLWEAGPAFLSQLDTGIP